MTSFMNSPWAAFYVVCGMLSAPVSQCSVYSVFTFPSLWLPPTIPPPATLPMAGCQDPPAATNHRAGCLPPYPLLPPILPPPARHPMTCVRTPPPATIPSLDINSCQIYYIYLWACGCTPSIADNYSYIATCILHSTFTLNFSNKHKLFHVFCSVMEYSCKSRHFLCISMLVLRVLRTSLTLIKSA